MACHIEYPQYLTKDMARSMTVTEKENKKEEAPIHTKPNTTTTTPSGNS